MEDTGRRFQGGQGKRPGHSGRHPGIIVRWWTGTEIHPGARIGKGVFIDHAAGVVIGESAIVGDGATLYHGVTLGATGNEKRWKRRPTLESGVFVGSGARIGVTSTLARGFSGRVSPLICARSRGRAV